MAGTWTRGVVATAIAQWGQMVAEVRQPTSLPLTLTPQPLLKLKVTSLQKQPDPHKMGHKKSAYGVQGSPNFSQYFFFFDSQFVFRQYRLSKSLSGLTAAC